MSGHLPAVESSFLQGGWTATCSCGWRGDFREGPAAHDMANEDAQEHAKQEADKP